MEVLITVATLFKSHRS